MSDTSAFLSCSVASDGFRLIDTSVKGDAIVDKDGVRTGTKYSVECEGEILGNDAADFAAKQTAFHAALASIERGNFIITAHGATEFHILAAQCIDHGPTVKNKLIDKQLSESVFVKKVKFTVEGSTAEGTDEDSQSGSPTSVKISTTTESDKTRTITYAGQFISAANNTRALFAAYKTSLISAYPAALWVETDDIEATFSDQQLTFKISFKELASPIDIFSNQFEIIDGELATSVERDEQFRKVITFSYNMTLKPGGDAQAFVTQARGLINEPILREHFSFTAMQNVTVQASFTILVGGDGNDLLDWEQTMDFPNIASEIGSPIRAFEFPGRLPLMVRGPDKPWRLVQRGRATGVNRYPRPAAPLFEFHNLEFPPVMTLRAVNSIERETVWTYTFLFREMPRELVTYYARLARPSGNAVRWMGAANPGDPGYGGG